MKDIGVGDVKDDRMTRAIGIIGRSYPAHPHADAVGSVFARIPAAARGT